MQWEFIDYKIDTAIHNQKLFGQKLRPQFLIQLLEKGKLRVSNVRDQGNLYYARLIYAINK